MHLVAYLVGHNMKTVVQCDTQVLGVPVCHTDVPELACYKTVSLRPLKNGTNNRILLFLTPM